MARWDLLPPGPLLEIFDMVGAACIDEKLPHFEMKLEAGFRGYMRMGRVCRRWRDVILVSRLNLTEKQFRRNFVKRENAKQRMLRLYATDSIALPCKCTTCASQPAYPGPFWISDRREELAQKRLKARLAYHAASNRLMALWDESEES